MEPKWKGKEKKKTQGKSNRTFVLALLLHHFIGPIVIDRPISDIHGTISGIWHIQFCQNCSPFP